MDSTRYTADTWAAYSDALAKAKAVYDNQSSLKANQASAIDYQSVKAKLQFVLQPMKKSTALQRTNK